MFSKTAPNIYGQLS